jgi:hypothetical protein
MTDQAQKVMDQLLKSMEKPTAEALYHQLGRLRNEMPPFQELGTPSASKWMGRALALVEAVDGTVMELVTLRTYFDHVNRNTPTAQTANMIAQVMDTVIAKVELKLPADAQGAFIPAGGVFDGYQAVSKALATAQKDVFLVDPYGDDKLISDFVPLAPEGVPVFVMCDELYSKPSLRPAAEHWIAQWRAKRPLEVRLAPLRSLHDRLIVTDSSTAEAELKPKVIETFDAVAGAYKSLRRLQDQDIQFQLKGLSLSPGQERKFKKLKNEIIGEVKSLRLNQARIDALVPGR